MVRDVRARLYEDDSALSRTDVDSVPMKVDVETLYILEQKSDKKSLPTNGNLHLTDANRSSAFDRHDFAMQANIPVTTIKPPNRPMGTQVETSFGQNTVSAQTTDTLHRLQKDRPNLLSSGSDEEGEVSKTIRTTTTTTRYEVKRRHSTHHTSEDEEEDVGGTAVIYLDDHERSSTHCHPPIDNEKVIERSSSFHRVTSQSNLDQIHYEDDEHRSNEVYEIHTRGACKCLVVSYEEATQFGPETRFEKQLKRIERTYTHEELKSAELHVIVTSSDGNYQLVRRDYGSYISRDEQFIDQAKQPAITIHYYTKDGHRMRSEHGRYLEHLPLFIRCEIEYELNHYGKLNEDHLPKLFLICLGSAQLILLSVTNAERRQMTTLIKKETVDETVTRLANRFTPNSPELEQEVTRHLTEQISLLHLVDYSSRDDYTQTNSTDIRRVSRTDVSTSLRLVQHYRTIIHRLCQAHRSHLRLTPQAEQQRHLILVARDEYYLLDLAAQSPHVFSNRTDVQKREFHHVTHQPFDYAKYRRDIAQQQRILEQHYRQTQRAPPQGQPSGPEFHLGLLSFHFYRGKNFFCF